MPRIFDRTPTGPTASRLRELDAFGSNPGNLRALIHAPAGGAAVRPLVVVLHGCTQTAAGYDAGAGWSTLADEQDFMLLFPEQRRANNPNLCFNWFVPGDTRRDEGEAHSIRQMIATLVRDHGADPARVFVTGLSAGGAMAAAMLATYPELFAAGAIIAGLPHGAASGVPQAMERMRGHGAIDAEALGARVRGASRHAGPWPRIAVWHGSRDATVHASNADAIVAQWRAVHAAADPPLLDTVDGHARRTWRDAAGRIVVEQYEIAGMGHGTPLRTTGADRCGVAGPFMLEAGISSTRHIAAAWGLTRPERAAASAPPPVATTLPVPHAIRAERIHAPAPKPAAPENRVTRIIEDALKAAGLMR